MTAEQTPVLRRRAVLASAAAIPVLAACGGGDDSDADTGSSPSGESSATQESTRFATADIPVEGGTIEDGIVVTQPSEGTFKAFDATCTHRQCTVNKIVDGAILCPCHFSAFDIETGEPVENPERGRKGPATSALTELTVTLDGADVVVT
ncbi:MAG: Rieske (2Fe-2S) protein [Candidatus Nanopelagicales bacterium]